MSFEVGFEGSVRVNRSEMWREGVPNQGKSMPKTARRKGNVDTGLIEKIEGGQHRSATFANIMLSLTLCRCLTNRSPYYQFIRELNARSDRLRELLTLLCLGHGLMLRFVSLKKDAIG